MSLKIQSLHAWEILDSRGRPTLSVEAVLSDGAAAVAQVPSGASTGTHEAVELRDGDPARYAGKGTLRAASHVNTEILAALRGRDAEDQPALDRGLIDLDGTPQKSRLGANALLGVSCAVARAVSVSRRQPLFETLSLGAPALPVPMINILSGGLHAGANIEFQDFLVIPHGFDSYAESLEATVKIHTVAAQLIRRAGYSLTGVADEGGWGPLLPSNQAALQLLTDSIEAAGYQPAAQVSIAIDVASSHFFENGHYNLRTEGRTLSSDAMVDLLAEWTRRFPVVSIEDGLFEDDWSGWRTLTARLSATTQLLGDDFFTTNPAAQVSIAIDVASSHFFEDGHYNLRTEGRTLSSDAMVDLFAEWTRRFPVVSIEDGLFEDDWCGWHTLTARLSATTQLLGDDFFTTNPARLRRGIDEHCANAVLVKMNQIGTLSETFEVCRLARANGYAAVVSARSGETEDSFLADLATATGAGQIKIGSITRSERLAKYNRLLELEARHGLPWQGRRFREQICGRRAIPSS